MEGIKLDKKDLRILDELDKNPNLNVNKLAKNVGLSRQVAEYRLNKLLSQKTIYNFYTHIDVSKLGYTLFDIHVKLKPNKKEEYIRFIGEIFADYPIGYTMSTSGSFDLFIEIFAKSLPDLENMLSEMVKKYSKIIQSYETSISFNMEGHEYRCFTEKNRETSAIRLYEKIEHFMLDEYDIKILHSIKFNSRKSYETIAKEVGLTRNAVKERILKLEKQKIIAGYSMVFDFHHLNKESFLIFVKYGGNNKEQEKELIQYLRQAPGVIVTSQLFGKWNLDIQLIKKDVAELQEFVIELRNKFDIIADYESVSIIEEHEVDWFPAKLQLK